MNRFLKTSAPVALTIGLVGCSWSSKPYGQDPLVQKNRAVPGDMRAMPNLCAADHPTPPVPPVDELASPPR